MCALPICASRRTPRRPPRASREHGASPPGACRERHFPGISAARNLHWSWEWLCSGSLHVGARSSHGRTHLLFASGTQGKRKTVVEGKRVWVRVDLRGRRIRKKKKK